jgi:prophage regulatory protein
VVNLMTGISQPRRILRLPAVLSRTSVCADTIYRWVRSGHFPKQIKLGERASGWFEDEVNAFLEGRRDWPGKPDRPDISLDRLAPPPSVRRRRVRA